MKDSLACKCCWFPFAVSLERSAVAEYSGADSEYNGMETNNMNHVKSKITQGVLFDLTYATPPAAAYLPFCLYTNDDKPVHISSKGALHTHR